MRIFNHIEKPLLNIIYFNILIFVLIIFFKILSTLMVWQNGDSVNQIIYEYLGLSSNINVLISHPWTLITHMFTHLDIIHLLSNLIWLYFGGKIFLNYLSKKEFYSTYVMGGLFGAITYVIFFNVFPVFKIIDINITAMGASAAAFAILIASASHVPNLSIPIIALQKIKLKHIAVFAVMINYFFMPSALENLDHDKIGGYIAHLGGAFYGYIFINMRKKNINMGYIIDKIIELFYTKKITSQTRRNESDYDYNARKVAEQKRINNILEKISQSGYESLSKEEKEELFNQK